MLVGLTWATIVGASELSELKAQGLVGERIDGYVGFVHTDAAAEVRSQVAEINAKRKAAYQRIATLNNISLQDVAALAGKKTVEKTARGQWIFIESWRQK